MVSVEQLAGGVVSSTVLTSELAIEIVWVLMGASGQMWMGGLDE